MFDGFAAPTRIVQEVRVVLSIGDNATRIVISKDTTSEARDLVRIIVCVGYDCDGGTIWAPGVQLRSVDSQRHVQPEVAHELSS
jgi:hypothetical protein